MKNPTLKLLAVAALSLGSISASNAAVVTSYVMNLMTVDRANTTTKDGATGGWWNQTIGYNWYVAGAPDADAAYTSIYFSVYLPTLTAGQSFSTFNLNVSNYSGEGLASKGDLYGMGTSNTISPSSLYYYSGVGPDTANGASLLQSDYLLPTNRSSIGVNWLASANIASYVNSFYASGVPTNQYLLLRLSAQDVTSYTAIGGYSMQYGSTLSGNATTGVFTGAPNDWPANYVSYDVIPEPTTWALLTFSLTSVMVLRRRRA